MSKTALYTAIINNRDAPKKIKFRNDFDYVLFTDNPNLQANGWTIRRAEWSHEDPVRVARYYKHNPTVVLPNYESSIWLDATHYPVADLSPLIEMLNDYDICCMRHFERSTSFAEAMECAKNKIDLPDVIQKQIERYRLDGFKDDLGLFETCCLVRKHNKIREFQSFWWNQICEGSKRDQISFTYSLWKTGVNCGVIPGYCRIKPNSFFKMVSHYPNGQLDIKML